MRPHAGPAPRPGHPPRRRGLDSGRPAEVATAAVRGPGTSLPASMSHSFSACSVTNEAARRRGGATRPRPAPSAPRRWFPAVRTGLPRRGGAPSRGRTGPHPRSRGPARAGGGADRPDRPRPGPGGAVIPARPVRVVCPSPASAPARVVTLAGGVAEPRRGGVRPTRHDRLHRRRAVPHAPRRQHARALYDALDQVDFLLWMIRGI